MNKNGKKLITGFCSLVVIFTLSGLTPAFALDLAQVYQLGLENDPQLRASRAALNSTLETRPQALAQLLPTLSAGGNLTRTHENIKGVSPGSGRLGDDDTYDSTGFSLSLNQPIYHYDYWIQLQQSDNQIAKAEAEHVSVAQNLIMRIAQAYFDVLAAQDTLGFTGAEKEAIQRQLDQAQQRFDMGFFAITDVHEAQAAFDNSTANMIQAENSVGDAWEVLHEIIGDTEKVLALLSPDLPLNPPEPQAIDQWSESAIRQNPVLIALRSATEVARQNIQLKRSGHYPTLNLVGSHALNRTAARGRLDSDVSFIGLQLSVPIYSGGRIISRTRQAQHDFSQSLENLDKQSRAIKRQARDTYRGVVSSISRVKALKATTISAKSALDATEAGFEAGTRTMVDVLTEQRNLYRARRDYSHVRYEYILNGLRLKLSAGILSQKDIEGVNAWLK